MVARMWRKKNEHSPIAGGIASWNIHSGNQCGSSSEKLDPALSLLGMYAKDAPKHKDMCSTIFIAALFIITKIGNHTDVLQSKMDTKMVVYLHSGLLLSC